MEKDLEIVRDWKSSRNLGYFLTLFENMLIKYFDRNELQNLIRDVHFENINLEETITGGMILVYLKRATSNQLVRFIVTMWYNHVPDSDTLLMTELTNKIGVYGDANDFKEIIYRLFDKIEQQIKSCQDSERILLEIRIPKDLIKIIVDYCKY